jgi:hypothetical protein
MLKDISASCYNTAEVLFTVVSDQQRFLSQTSYANISIPHSAHPQVAIATLSHDD